MEAEDFLKFLGKTQHLKSILRHSWIDDNSRQESVSDHSWHMAMMAIALEPFLENEIDLKRVLKMIIIHDVGEVVIGDIPAFSNERDGKYETEEKAVQDIVESLPLENQKEILGLWKEYEERKTQEAIFVKMLDALDVLFQHLTADISTWTEKELTFNLKRRTEEYFKREPFLYELYNLVHKKLEEKVLRFMGGAKDKLAK